jgi:hypothetical protein
VGFPSSSNPTDSFALAEFRLCKKKGGRLSVFPLFIFAPELNPTGTVKVSGDSFLNYSFDMISWKV